MAEKRAQTPPPYGFVIISDGSVPWEGQLYLHGIPNRRMVVQMAGDENHGLFRRPLCFQQFSAPSSPRIDRPARAEEGAQEQEEGQEGKEGNEALESKPLGPG